MSPPSTPFDLLRAFLSSKMRMSHVYQPLILKMLIESGGWASIREIASTFLAQDDCQIDYYAEITKRARTRASGADRQGPGEVRKRNELRRDAQLSLLDIEAEAARLQWLDRDTAYESFFKIGAEIVAHAR